MLRSARQGSLDGLCGVYAIINALELAGVELDRGSVIPRDMFKQLTHGLGAVGLLAAMQDGTPVDDLVGATTLAFAWLKAVHGFGLEVSQPLRHSRIRSPRAFLAAVRGYLDLPETAVVISYERPGYAHWTVVRAITATELELRDSGSASVLRLADFRRANAVWRFWPTDTLLIRRTR